jgi:hypothetical protein
VAFLVALWGKIQLYVLVGLAGVALVVGAYFYGKHEQRLETKAEQAEQRVKDINRAREIENEVPKLSDPDLDRRLDKFMRD